MASSEEPSVLVHQLQEEKKNQRTMIRMLSLALILFVLAGGYSYYITNKYDQIVRELSEALHNQREQFLDCVDMARVPPHVTCVEPVSPSPNDIIDTLDDISE